MELPLDKSLFANYLSNIVFCNKANQNLDLESKASQDLFARNLEQIADTTDKVVDELARLIDLMIRHDGNLKDLKITFKPIPDPLFDSLEGAILRLRDKPKLEKEAQILSIVNRFSSTKADTGNGKQLEAWELDKDLLKAVSILLYPSLRNLVIEGGEYLGDETATPVDYGAMMTRLDPLVFDRLLKNTSKHLLGESTEQAAAKLANVIESLYAFRAIPEKYSGFIQDVIRNRHNQPDDGAFYNACIAYGLLENRQAYDQGIVEDFTNSIVVASEPHIAKAALIALTNQELPAQALTDNQKLFPSLIAFLGDKQPVSFDFGGSEKGREPIFKEGLRHYAASILSKVESFSKEQFSTVVDLLNDPKTGSFAEMILSRYIRKELESCKQDSLNQLISSTIDLAGDKKALTSSAYLSLRRVLDSLEKLQPVEKSIYDVLERGISDPDKLGDRLGEISTVKDLVSDEGEVLPMFAKEASKTGFDLDIKLESLESMISALGFVASVSEAHFELHPLSVLKEQIVSYGPEALPELISCMKKPETEAPLKLALLDCIDSIFTNDKEFLFGDINLEEDPVSFLATLGFNYQRYLAPEIKQEQVEENAGQLLQYCDQVEHRILREGIRNILINKTPSLIGFLKKQKDASVTAAEILKLVL